VDIPNQIVHLVVLVVEDLVVALAVPLLVLQEPLIQVVEEVVVDIHLIKEVVPVVLVSSSSLILHKA